MSDCFPPMGANGKKGEWVGGRWRGKKLRKKQCTNPGKKEGSGVSVEKSSRCGMTPITKNYREMRNKNDWKKRGPAYVFLRETSEWSVPQMEGKHKKRGSK